MSDKAPWSMRDHDLNDEVAKARVSAVIYTLAETLRICSILLLPYMPGRAGEALDRLGVTAVRRTFEYAVRGADASYGMGFREVETRGSAGSLFPPLASREFPEEAGEPLVEARAARRPGEERARKQELKREERERQGRSGKEKGGVGKG